MMRYDERPSGQTIIACCRFAQKREGVWGGLASPDAWSKEERRFSKATSAAASAKVVRSQATPVSASAKAGRSQATTASASAKLVSSQATARPAATMDEAGKR